MSILLYGAGCWCLTEKLFNQLRVFHARCVSEMCRVNRWHAQKYRISTLELLKRTGLSTIDAYGSRRQLRWAGHVARMDFDRLPLTKEDAFFMGHREKAFGGPEFTYGRGVFKALKKADIDRNTWHVEAPGEDGEGWRDQIAQVM